MTRYKTKVWALDAFEYDPFGYKPEWFSKGVEVGQIFEYGESKASSAFAQFGDKRSTHKAFIGDRITLDMFGRLDVYSPRHFNERVHLVEGEGVADNHLNRLTETEKALLHKLSMRDAA